ncbi:MAG: hypothetical protein KDH94_02790 [Coxiellaceae bacterium]|nr:hypothetical protein [Coxiellaceae bacterium]
MKKPQFEKVQMLPFWKPEEEGEQIEGVVQNRRATSELQSWLFTLSRHRRTLSKPL